MKKKITAILMTAALMLTMAACAGNSTADTGVESSASSAVSSKPVSNTSSTAASSAKPSASAKPTATPSAGAAATVKPTATPKPESKTESSTAGKTSATATPKPAATAKPNSSDLQLHRLRSRQLYPPQLRQLSLRQLLPQYQRRFPPRRRSPKKRSGSWTYLLKKKSGIGKTSTGWAAIGSTDAISVVQYALPRLICGITKVICPRVGATPWLAENRTSIIQERNIGS